MSVVAGSSKNEGAGNEKWVQGPAGEAWCVKYRTQASLGQAWSTDWRKSVTLPFEKKRKKCIQSTLDFCLKTFLEMRNHTTSSCGFLCFQTAEKGRKRVERANCWMENRKYRLERGSAQVENIFSLLSHWFGENVLSRNSPCVWNPANKMNTRVWQFAERIAKKAQATQDQSEAKNANSETGSYFIQPECTFVAGLLSQLLEAQKWMQTCRDRSSNFWRERERKSFMLNFDSFNWSLLHKSCCLFTVSEDFKQIYCFNEGSVWRFRGWWLGGSV